VVEKNIFMNVSQRKHTSIILKPRYNWNFVESGIKNYNPPNRALFFLRIKN